MHWASCAAGEGGEVSAWRGQPAAPEAELETIALLPRLSRHGLARRLFVELAAKLVAARLQRSFWRCAARISRRWGFPAAGLFTEQARVRYYHDPVEDAV